MVGLLHALHLQRDLQRDLQRARERIVWDGTPEGRPTDSERALQNALQPLLQDATGCNGGIRKAPNNPKELSKLCIKPRARYARESGARQVHGLEGVIHD